MSNIEAYKHGSFYEIFMHRAFKTTDRTKPGMHGSAIQNLIEAENGESILIDFLGSFDKQFGQVKKYMHRAMDKYLSVKKLPSETIEALQILNASIDRAHSSDNLMKIVYETIDLTQSIK
jgi:hypothetical protein